MNGSQHNDHFITGFINALKISLSCVPVLFCFMLNVCMGSENNDPSYWNIRAFTAPNDLPNEVVRDAVMTRDGSVWLATWGGGIVIMDGTHKRLLSTEDGLISNDIRMLEKDPVGRVWAGTPDGISCIYNGKIYNFTTEPFAEKPGSNSISAIESMENGEVWFGIGHTYLYAWIPSRDENDGMNGKWKLIHHFTGHPDAVIEDIKQNDAQEIWIALNRVGMGHFRSSAKYQIIPWDKCPSEEDQVCRRFVFTPLDRLVFISRRTVIECSDNQILETYVAPYELTCINWAFGKLFIGTDEGLYILNEGQWKFCPLTMDKRRNYIESISYMSDGSLWVCTRSGVFRFTEPTWIEQKPSASALVSESLAANDKNQLFCTDRDLTLWMYSQKEWTPLYQFNSIQKTTEKFDINIQENRLVLCSRFRVVEFDVSERKIMNEVVLPGDPHVGGDKPILLPDENNVWFTGELGIVKWDQGTYKPAIPLPHRSERFVYSILETNPGEYWIGGRGWIEHWFKGEYPETDIPESLLGEGNKIVASMKTQEGELWFSQLGRGILRYKDGQWIQETITNGLKSNYILSLYQSSDGTIWAGDRNHGIMSFKNGRWIRYGYEDGIPVGPVISIVENEQHRIWFGIFDDGIYAYYPDRLAPKAEIVSSPDHLIPDAPSVFSYKGYDAWNHTRRDELVYSWRIVSSNAQQIVQDWSSVTYETSALLPPLKPGKYIFEVIAQDTFRNSSLEPAQARFKVEPYFWMSYSFQLPVVFSAFFASLSAFLWWRHHQRVKEELIFEKLTFQEFCEAANIGIIKFSKTFELLDVNFSMAKIAGFSSIEEMLNHPAPLQWENKDDYRGFLSSLYKGEKVIPITLMGKQPKTGRDFYVRLYGVIKGEEIDILVIDLTKQRQLEKEIVLTSTKEQQKIGRDLHDGILQELTGISFLAQLVVSNLEQNKLNDINDLKMIVQMIDDLRTKTRKFSKGLSPLTLGKLGFHAALQELVSGTQKLYKIDCSYETDLNIQIGNEEAELHLYHIAHEAMNNAAKHSSAQRIRLILEQEGDSIVLSVEDDGKGFLESGDHDGMGIQIMKLRAGVIAADLKIHRNGNVGTVVECRYSPAKINSHNAMEHTVT